MDADLDRLYRLGSYPLPTGGPARGMRGGGGGGAPPDPPPPDLADLRVLEEKLTDAPESTLRLMRRTYRADLSLADAHNLIADAIQAVTSPEAAIAWIEATPRGFPTRAPAPPFTFEGQDPTIPIDPGNHQLEEKRDWWGWVSNCAGYWIKGEFRKKDALRRHEDHPQTGFVYPLPEKAELRVALFADFGTGLYHSRHIGRWITDARPDCAIHLGDVYYAGRASDFAQRFTPVVEPLIAQTPFYMLNANHEMMAGGFSYFDLIDHKRALRPELHQQEGSYFALHNSRFQIIALDTDYEDDGTHRDDARNLWLEKRLIHGRRNGLVNILLTPDEPYALGAVEPTTLYAHDLLRFIRPGMVDLWFWGNTHYCALYGRSPRAPFVGSCIGHGGFPYDTVRERDILFPDALTRVEWFEAGTRFPEESRIRPDRGNNGFVMMTLRDDRTVGLEYIDWMKRARHTSRLAQSDDRRLVDFVR